MRKKAFPDFKNQFKKILIIAVEGSEAGDK
jgi:hypothetical protein